MSLARGNKSHPRTTPDPATKRGQQTYRPDPTLPHETGTKETGMPNTFRESTVHEITKEIPENIEKILPSHTIPPWRNDAKEKRYATRLTTNPARRGTTKGEAADEHRTRISQISQKKKNTLLHTPTDQ